MILHKLNSNYHVLMTLNGVADGITTFNRKNKYHYSHFQKLIYNSLGLILLGFIGSSTGENIRSTSTEN